MQTPFRAVLLGTLISLATVCHADVEATKAATSDSGAGSAAPAGTAAKAADAIKVENPFVRAVAPGQTNSAAFMTLLNDSDTDHSVASAASSAVTTVELHTHTDNHGVMEMRQVDKIDVPAKGRTELKSGGLHIMLIGLKQELKVGETVALTLTFEDGSTTTVDAPVQEVTPPADGKMDSMSSIKY